MRALKEGCLLRREEQGGGVGGHASLGGGVGESPSGRTQQRGHRENLVQRYGVRELISRNHGSWGKAAHQVEEIGRAQTMTGLPTRLRHPEVWTSCWRN